MSFYSVHETRKALHLMLDNPQNSKTIPSTNIMLGRVERGILIVFLWYTIFPKKMLFLIPLVWQSGCMKCRSITLKILPDVASSRTVAANQESQQEVPQRGEMLLSMGVQSYHCCLAQLQLCQSCWILLVCLDWQHLKWR